MPNLKWGKFLFKFCFRTTPHLTIFKKIFRTSPTSFFPFCTCTALAPHLMHFLNFPHRTKPAHNKFQKIPHPTSARADRCGNVSNFNTFLFFVAHKNYQSNFLKLYEVKITKNINLINGAFFESLLFLPDSCGTSFFFSFPQFVNAVFFPTKTFLVSAADYGQNTLTQIKL